MWIYTGSRGKYGRIYRESDTGKLAEEHDGQHLVEMPGEEGSINNASMYLAEQDRISTGLPL